MTLLNTLNGFAMSALGIKMAVKMLHGVEPLSGLSFKMPAMLL